MNKYELIVLCGKAGAGKDYLLQQIKNHFKEKVNIIVSDTTRPKRSFEKDGVDYNFLTPIEFYDREHIERTGYEIMPLSGWLYGTPMSALNINKLNIGVFNLDGIRQLYQNDNLNIHIFYISANDRTRLLRQMDREEYPNYIEICRRFLSDEKDFKNLSMYPHKENRNSSSGRENEAAKNLFDEINQILSDFDKMN